MKKRVLLVICLNALFIGGCFWFTFRPMVPIAKYENGIWSSNGYTRKLILNGISYISERGFFYPKDKIDFFNSRQLARTEKGETVKSIPGEDPHDWIIVIGDMEEELYRRDDLKRPEFTSDSISELKLSGTDISTYNIDDTTIISGLRNVLSRPNNVELDPSMINKGPYGLEVTFKKYPGIISTFSIVKLGTNWFIQADPFQSTRYIPLNGTTLGKWIQENLK
jgi:hypothetical protein